MKKISTLAAVGGIALLTAASMTLGSQEVIAADHGEAPGSGADNIADIADFYAWPTDDGKIVAIITFAGLQAPGADPSYDRDVLYSVHIDNTALEAGLLTAADPNRTDNDNDNVSDIDINVRFGVNGFGDWGVQVEGLPGTDAPIQGAVGEAIDDGSGNMIQAGTFDDPFFFDLAGFNTTLMNTAMHNKDEGAEDLAFASVIQFFDGTEKPALMPAADALAGFNVHAIVLEIDAEAAFDGNADNLIQTWATSSRITE